MPSVDPTNLCWVASYPKSGNTWVRFLIAGLFKGVDVTSADLETLIPDAHEMARKGSFQLPESMGSTSFIKTHWMFDQAQSAFSVENRCVYILRNPMDVLASHLNFTKFSSPELKPVFTQEYIERGGSPIWFSHGMGSWLENAKSWLGGPNRKLILIYEDLLQDPVVQVERLASFLEIEIEPDQAEALVRGFQFNTLRTLEASERSEKNEGLFANFSGSREDGAFFMNKGRANYFRDVLSESSVEKGLKAFKSPINQIEDCLGRPIESWSFLSD